MSNGLRKASEVFTLVQSSEIIMHLSMLSRRGGSGIGGAFFEQIFNQMPHRGAINIGQIPHHFAINCNKYYINKSHSVQIAPTRG